MKPNLRFKPIRRFFVVPIYEAAVWVVVADDLVPERKRHEHRFGPCPSPDYSAISSYNGGGKFALFFHPEAVRTSTVGHEVFHMTHRILQWVSAPLTPDHHEHAALLHGWLLDRVSRIVGLNHA